MKQTGEFGELVTMDHKISIEKDEGCPYFENEKGNLDPETALEDHVYLDCTQRDSKPSKEVIRAKQELFAKLMSNQSKGSDPEAGVRRLHSYQNCVALCSLKGLARATAQRKNAALFILRF